MSRDQVDASIKALAAAGIKTVRTYSTDCDTLPNIGDACEKYGVKMIVGIFVDSVGCQATRYGSPSVPQQMDAIAKWARWELVPLAVIGNEGVINGFCTPAQIAGLIQTARGKWPGYKGPYTTAETVNVWQQEGAKEALCGVVDVVGANAWAFFDLKTSAKNAGTFVKGQLDIISKVCPGKKGYVLETGWPSAGNPMGAAIPGLAEQADAIKSIVAEVGESVVILSPFNDQWKDGNTACACEQHFGCKDVLGISGLPM
ncbi:glucan endo-1,3-beta-D-glucosidase [Microdochium nivale]|nr:glucan endo-1,3-beta-D-glucosidase [Microdochium nivale]